jgi:hypothetical protein
MIMKNVKVLWLVSICLFAGLYPAKSQFFATEIDSSSMVIDVRKGSVVEYSMDDDADPGEEFRWEVTGGVIITPGAVGGGTTASPSVLEFAADMHTVEVQWQADDSTSGFFTGDIMVQKKTIDQCTSNIIKQRINQWSMPAASISKAYPDFNICSGEEVGGYIVVDLAGAAGFTFRYSIRSNGLFDETGIAINTEFREITTLNDTAHIALPALLVNPSAAASKYFTIELTAMNDDFLGAGEIVTTGKEFTITVYPSVNIGPIESTKLNRR